MVLDGIDHTGNINFCERYFRFRYQNSTNAVVNHGQSKLHE
jgi:hypothetical protein